jgi:hypothetical protein
LVGWSLAGSFARVAGRSAYSDLSSRTGPLDVTGDPRNTVLIAGSGRSGTTWLAEIVNHRNDYGL